MLGFTTTTETYGAVRVMLTNGMLEKVGQVEREKLPSGKGAPGKRQDLFSFTATATDSFAAMLGKIAAADVPADLPAPVAVAAPTIPTPGEPETDVPAIVA